jgi:hypothetical protein
MYGEEEEDNQEDGEEDEEDGEGNENQMDLYDENGNPLYQAPEDED